MTEAEQGARRVVAVVLPELLCELAGASLFALSGGQRASSPKAQPPLGVLLTDTPVSGQEESSRSVPAAAVLEAVNDSARHFGVRAGQTVTEAHAFVARLVVREVTREQIRARLGEVAEIALGFGPTVSIEAPDTVWVDVTGASHLAGGEERLALELVARVRAIGHRARVAVAGGPRLAQAVGRWGRISQEGVRVVSDTDVLAVVGALPVRALPLSSALVAWLVRLGVHTVGDLAKLPRSAVAPRLGEAASAILDLASGKDAAPLDPYVPPPMPREETTWENAAEGVEPLLFVLRGLVSRLGARLEGRGEAVQALDLVVQYDRAVARLEGAEPSSTLHFDLASPLHRPEELFRVLAARLGRFRLAAPVVGLRIEAKAVTRALSLQLSLSRYAAGLGGAASRGPETLPVIVAELVADLGKDRVGVLEAVSSHRPERKSRLVSPELGPARSKEAVREPSVQSEVSAGTSCTRLLPRPVPFDAPLRLGATVSLDHRLYTIENILFDQRLESVEWWTKAPISRDYLRVWLRGSQGVVEAAVFVDRATGSRKVQGIRD